MTLLCYNPQADRWDPQELRAGLRLSTRIIPGQWVSVVPLTIALTGKALQQAMPLALAEHIVSPLSQINSQHLGSEQSSHWMAVIDKAHANKIRQALQKGQQYHLVPDYLAIPYRPQTWSITQHQDRVLIRFCAYTGAVLTRDQWETQCADWLEMMPTDTIVEYLSPECDGLNPQLQSLSQRWQQQYCDSIWQDIEHSPNFNELIQGHSRRSWHISANSLALGLSLLILSGWLVGQSILNDLWQEQQQSLESTNQRLWSTITSDGTAPKLPRTQKNIEQLQQDWEAMLQQQTALEQLTHLANTQKNHIHFSHLIFDGRRTYFSLTGDASAIKNMIKQLNRQTGITLQATNDKNSWEIT